MDFDCFSSSSCDCCVCIGCRACPKCSYFSINGTHFSQQTRRIFGKFIHADPKCCKRKVAKTDWKTFCFLSISHSLPFWVTCNKRVLKNKHKKINTYKIIYHSVYRIVAARILPFAAVAVAVYRLMVFAVTDGFSDFFSFSSTVDFPLSIQKPHTDWILVRFFFCSRHRLLYSNIILPMRKMDQPKEAESECGIFGFVLSRFLSKSFACDVYSEFHFRGVENVANHLPVFPLWVSDMYCIIFVCVFQCLVYFDAIRFFYISLQFFIRLLSSSSSCSGSAVASLFLSKAIYVRK